MASNTPLMEDRARFWRYMLLLSDVGREVMLKQFTIQDLQTKLNAPKMQTTIRKNKKISQDQIDQLYPKSGQPVKPEEFDITLLAFVLKVVFGVKDPQLPVASTDPSQEADLYRLREIRNQNAHSAQMALPDQTFLRKWEELKKILLRLGSKIQGLEKRIDEYKDKIIDPRREKELQTIIEYWREKAQIPQGLRSLMTSSKDFLDDCVEDDVYIKTSAYQKAKKVMDRENFLVISGLPGEGKTTMAQKLVMELSSPEKCIVLDNPEDWVNVDTESVPIDYIIIDDIFGAGALDQRLAKLWESRLKQIERRMKIAKFKTIITTRHYILEEAKHVARYASLFKTGENVVHISSKDLSTEERRGILSAHLQKSKRGDQGSQAMLIQECIGTSTNFFARFSYGKPTDFTFGFPQCVDMFVNHSELFDKGSTFFTNPKQFFMDVLEDLKRDRVREKFLALILMWARGGKPIHKAELSHAALGKDLQRIANGFGFSLESVDTLIEVVDFFKNHRYDLFDYQPNTGAYTFSHNVIGDMIGLVLCKDYPQQTLKYSSRDFILEYVTTAKKKNTSDYFYVEEHEYTYLSERLVELMLRDLPPVRKSSVRHLKKGGRCPNKLVPSYQIDTGFIDKSFFNNKRFVKCFVKYAKNDVQKVFNTQVMTMSGYFLGTGITNKDIKVYLPEYFLLNDNALLIDELIDQDVPWGTSDDQQREISLTVAVHKDAKETAEMLLMVGAVATQETVYIAAVHENLEIITLLMKSEQSPNSINSSRIFQIVEGNSPLIIAAKKGLYTSVRCLVDNGADIKYRNNAGFCALDKAVLFKHTDVCRFLLNVGTPVNGRQRQFNRTPLHVASDIGSVDIVRLLLEHGSNDSLREKDHRGQYPIHCAAFRGHIGVVEVLLQHDESLATQRAISYGQKSVVRGMTVYHVAVWKNNLELIQMLVDSGVKPDTKDCFGRTPLYCAVFDDKVELVNLLLPHSDPNATDKKGRTPLYCAVLYDKVELVKLLLPHSDPNVKDKEGRTPLYCAALNGKKHLVELLLPRTDPNATDKTGRTPLCAAMVNKHMAVAKLLCLHTDVNIPDNEGATVLHEACKRGNVSFVWDLIATHRADYMSRDKAGRTAYDVATSAAVKDNIDIYIEASKRN